MSETDVKKFEFLKIHSQGFNTKETDMIKNLVQNMEEKNEFPPDNLLGLSWFRSLDVLDSKKYGIIGLGRNCQITTKQGFYLFFEHVSKHSHDVLVQKYNYLLNKDIERRERGLRMLENL